ncbi:MAG: fibronectin type III domain-containing protein, partial [Methanomassiliicoccales archaeon]
GSPITAYKVYYGLGAPNILYQTYGVDILSAEVVGLSPGSTYSFAVQAINGVDVLPLSNILAATPYTTPGAPTLETAVAGFVNTTITWTAPASDGGSPITAYKVYYGLGAPNTLYLTSGAGVLSAEIIGIFPGSVYSFAVKAVNLAGDSAQSNVMTATPYTVPGAPTMQIAFAGISSVSITWATPVYDGTSPITAYKVFYGLGAPNILYQTYGASITSAVLTGLVPGSTYSFAVKAVNLAGDSAQSNILTSTPYDVSGAPTLQSATAGSSKVTITWTAPASDGGSPITAYKVYYGLGAPNTLYQTYGAGVLSAEIISLSPGSLYSFAVQAVNLAGGSPSSNILTAAPYTVPGVPTLQTATTSGDSSAVITWAAPTSSGGSPITGYRVYYGLDSPGILYQTYGASTMSAVLTGLVPGSAYSFAVKAVNLAGDSAQSNVMTAMPHTVPGAPTLDTATAGSSSVVLAWSAPSYDGGAPITAYKVYYGIGSPTILFGPYGPSTRSVEVVGLTPGSAYSFAVKAVNLAGDSPLSNIMTAMPYTVPGAPTLQTAVAGIVNATITWTAPVYDGSSSITAYKVYYGIGAPNTLYQTYGASITSAVLTGLVPGSTYSFAVKAVNLAGDSPLSNIMTSTPYIVPGAPTLQSAIAGPSSVSITWTAPASDGSSPITAYEVYCGIGAPNTLYQTSGPSTMSAVLTGLVPGSVYSFAVKAVNLAGDSPLSNIMTAMPYTVPGAPTLQAAMVGSSKVTITWAAPASNGSSSITAYKVYYGIGAPTIFFGPYGSSTRTVEVVGLTPGSVYSFAVKAVNLAGDSPSSNIRTAMPYTVPGAPTLQTATAGSSNATITWTAPASNGSSSITAYRVYYGIGAPNTLYQTSGPSIMSAVLTGLVPGNTYSFAVKAVNLAGDSAQSNVMAATSHAAPGAPTLQSVIAGPSSVSITWTAPASDGGSPITGYKVLYGTTPDPTTQFGGLYGPSIRSAEVTGLTPGVQYYFAIEAVNVVGDSQVDMAKSASPHFIAAELLLLIAVIAAAVIAVTYVFLRRRAKGVKK